MAAPDDFRSRPEKELLDYATHILQGEQTSQQVIVRLARALKNRYNRFGAARKLLWLARSDSERVTEKDTRSAWQRKLAQQHALCTYKDQDLSAYTRFDLALKILREEDLRDLADPTAAISQETLGIAGAIYKAQWEAFGQRAYLYQALACYQRGWKQRPGAGEWQDDGYTGLNAAFILDVIANQEEPEAEAMGARNQAAAEKRAEARAIRIELVEKLPAILTKAEAERQQPVDDPDKQEERVDRVYWLLVTLGEALAGLGLDDPTRVDAAKSYYTQARALQRYDWMVESSARQLTTLTRLHRNAGPSDAERAVVESLVGDTAPGVESAFLGKVGLALSGGGFRASLFHIGVLARLAELDMLRHIEFLSCVSGGSIIGAYYYLELRKLLESKTDGEIQRDDYIRLVQEMEKNFTEGVRQNIRMQAIADYHVNLSHDILTGALPTEHVAELYEKELYSRTGVKPEGREASLYLSELIIRPAVLENGAKKNQLDFRPKEGNWKRRNKVPVLVLNATSLNTGHNWQFTATWMGEPPTTVNNEIDGNQRLRRMYYSEAPAGYHSFRLGRAVGASACVPALFTPLEMPQLYPDTSLRLVDGGVHDNQGVASLIDQGCTVMLVSDASGQLRDQADPISRISKTGLRADEIVQERVRVAQYQDLESRRRSGLLRSLMFLHLKKDLQMPPLDWIGCPLPNEASEDAKPAAEKGLLTSYSINREVQRAIAGIRTDLDAFHQAEAWALMTSGYQMTKFHFPAALASELSPPPAESETLWTFLQALPQMRSPSPDREFLALLQKSGQLFFKAWDVPAGFKRTVWKRALAALAVAGLVLLGLLWLAYQWPGPALLLLAAVIAALLVVRSRMTYSFTQHTLALLLAGGAGWYLRQKNRQYLDAGKWRW